MRLHITVTSGPDAGDVARSAEMIRRGLDDERRWDDIEAALGAILDQGHEWGDDPGEWVRQQRADKRRVG